MTGTRNDFSTLGGLIDALADLPQGLPVYVDNRVPTALSSYRGYYDHLAIERSGDQPKLTEVATPGRPFDSEYLGRYTPGTSEVRIAYPATVSELSDALKLAVGETFEGYKGGQYTMTWNTPLWVSEYGDATRRRICAIEHFDDTRVDLLTKEVAW